MSAQNVLWCEIKFSFLTKMSPSSRVLLDKQIITQLITKFSAFYRNIRLIHAPGGIRIHDLSRWAAANSVLMDPTACQFKSHHPFYDSMILILSYHLCLGVQSDLPPFKFSDGNFLCISYLFHACYVSHLLDFKLLIIFGEKE
jgi:hypothetical protein